MGVLRLLNHDHLAEIYRLAALSVSSASISQRLKDGITTPAGVTLSAVEVSADLVRYHMGTDAGRAAIDGHRERLYGDARQSASWWLSWRLGRLEAIVEGSMALAGDVGLTVSERVAAYRSATRALGELRQQLAPVAQAGESGARHLHLHGEATSQIAQQMLELQQIGRLGPALERIAARAGSASAADITPAGAEADQDAHQPDAPATDASEQPPAPAADHEPKATPGEPPSGSDDRALGTHGVPVASVEESEKLVGEEESG